MRPDCLRAVRILKKGLGRRDARLCRDAYTSNYWSATENNANNAWRVNFSDGSVNNNNKNNANYVRCVQG